MCAAILNSFTFTRFGRAAVVALLVLLAAGMASPADAQGQRGDRSNAPTEAPGNSAEGAVQPADANERKENRRSQPANRELVISEVLQNPQLTYDSTGEWFEIHNPWDRAVELNGWYIGDLNQDEHLIQSDQALIIEPGGYFVLGANPDVATNGGVILDYSYGASIKLYNAADSLVLQTSNGQVADRVAWDDGASFPDPNGASMAVIDLQSSNEDAGNWCTSTTEFGVGDLGTPGAPTDCTPAPQIRVSEIMQNPDVTADYKGEWFEVGNFGNTAVDLNGWTIHDDDDDRHVVASSVVIEPGNYAVFARNGDSAANGGVTPAYVYGDDVRLFNSWDELTLVDPYGRRAQRIKWDDGRTFPDPTGASMSLADLSLDGSAGSNWCTATTPFGAGDRGTPGQANTCTTVPLDVGPDLVINEIMRNPTAISDIYGEWFELYNPNAFDVDLAGWTVRDHDANWHQINASIIVPAGGYTVLGRSDAHGGPAHAYVYDNMVLHNGSDELVLVNPSGAIVDQVVWDNNEFPAEAGSSMALEAVHLNTSVGESWCPSAPTFGDGDHGTPGHANICGDTQSDVPIVISEMMINPAASYDSHGEWFELHNFGAAPIDLQGFVIKDEDFNEFTIDASLVVEPGGFAVLARLGETAFNGGVQASYVFGTEMVLINGGDELVVLDTERRVVDRVLWGAGYGFTIPSGSSLQLVDVAAENLDASAWCQAYVSMPGGDAGTPGRATDCDADAGDSGYEPESEHPKCSSKNRNVIMGSAGDDVLIGTDGNDVIVGLAGNDKIDGRGGNDIICAGPGDDIVEAGNGNDLVLGGSGNDTIDAGSGNDEVLGGAGSDALTLGQGNDSAHGGPDRDKIDGGPGNDKIDGGQGSDVVHGGDGRDICTSAEDAVSCEKS